MLMITNSAAVDEERWILCGRLTGPWVAELRSNWDQVRGRSRGCRYVIDLSDVTLIDESGLGLLGELRDEGAEFVARGVYTRHLLETSRARKSGRSRDDNQR
jgi:anti-anti-sigma regulatory factor